MRVSCPAREAFTFVPFGRVVPEVRLRRDARRVRAAWLRRTFGRPHSRPRQGAPLFPR
jgi:hypothetical protein